MKETLFNYPEYAEVNGKKYKINTDFRVAIKCNDISMQNIDDVEKVMAIIYLLFGEEALRETKYYNQFAEKAIYFLRCGDKNDTKPINKNPDMDFIQDFPFIEASFMSDYGMSLKGKEMHWWEFYYLICGLSQSEFGNSCILNRIRELRNLDLSKIKDPKEKERLKKAKEQFALKKRKESKVYSDEEKKAIEEYHKLVGD